MQAFHEESATAKCSCCDTPFEVRLAFQVVYVGGRRHYACTPHCHHQLIRAGKAPSLGELQSLPSNQRRPDQPSSRLPTPRGAPAAPRVIAVFNHKGGTGKTTTSVTLAAGLAAAGRRVLLVDADPQGNVAASLAMRTERTLYHVLVMGLDPQQVVQRVRPNLDVLPSNESLAAAELYLAGRRQRDRIMGQRLSAFAADYDYVLVDCSPSLSLLNQNALVLADSLLCPVACDYLSLVGVRQVERTLKNVNRLVSHPVQLWGVLPTFYDSRANVCREALETLQERFRDRCLTPIRSATRVKEAPARGKTLLEYAATSRAALDYCVIVDQLLSDNGWVARSA